MKFLYPKSPKNWSEFREPWDTALKMAGFNIFDVGYASVKTRATRAFSWFCIMHFCLSAFMFLHSEDWKLDLVSEAISVSTVGLIILVQTFTLHLKQDEFKKLTSVIDSYWATTHDEEHLNMLIKRGKEGCRTAFVLFLLCISTVSTFTINSLWQRKQRVLPQIFPAYGLHNLDTYYYITNFLYHEFIMSYVLTCLIPFHNIYVHLALQIVAQLDILSLQINRLGKCNDSDEHVDKVLRHCYYRHLEVIWCVKQVSSVFKSFLFAQVTFSTIVITLVMFTIFNRSSISSLNTAVIFLCATLLHLFIFCWYGEAIETGSENLSRGIYDASWENLEPRRRRSLVATLRSAQRSRRVAVDGVFDVRLELFALVLRSAYSWSALLSTVDE